MENSKVQMTWVGCTGGDCEKKESCYRFRIKEDSAYQCGITTTLHKAACLQSNNRQLFIMIPDYLKSVEKETINDEITNEEGE